jgi:hypothetical protein
MVCGDETSLFICSVPICLKCDGLSVEARRLRAAALKADAQPPPLRATA